ncbi:MAG: hypothetical protein A2365_01175 [Candidatus Nealsonbacteria bacterium RIFOXYB1_FULL_40_15]|uniref:Polymerase nucleotidyl transferase domain-containing protein n=2 Tax=Candidatus Nealsoniibacteriota TaxID=1817911 RepID=A0A1G2ELF6_9BACT|nr:MAG: hypothetical protein A2427_04705 [Candidatus Nealsonbacteria bacterium RIFOXYC1_FULL_40_7]OGZ26882.1 MAG: hypothetical protein A2365_01175 [Candidatus Nealsonbacteria bacterium RIFOXYB1_FULL_40_15]OGZ29307.1 MAG: hypothetical protein A2562_01630 [Candidatus Nealsonbacteria bacterium RIFOXYD1_FULL_39_11]
MSVSQIKTKIKKQELFLKSEFRVKKIGVFGSYSRNEQKKRSDIDILVEFSEEPGLFKFLALEEFLSQILNAKVDLVMKSALKPHIGKMILKEVNYI